jgi:hypothetical protein
LPQTLPQPVGFVGTGVLNDFIYVVGGYDGSQEFNQTYAFNPESGDLQPKAPMQEPRGGLAVIPGGNNLFAIGGGWEHNSEISERYDPNSDTWSPVETPFTGQWRNLGLATVDTSIYAVGGWDGADETYMDSVVSYQFIYQLFLPISTSKQDDQ